MIKVHKLPFSYCGHSVVMVMVVMMVKRWKKKERKKQSNKQTKSARCSDWQSITNWDLATTLSPLEVTAAAAAAASVLADQ